LQEALLIVQLFHFEETFSFFSDILKVELVMISNFLAL